MNSDGPLPNIPSLDDDSEIPRIDLAKEFGPDNPNVQVNPIFNAFSIGMQQMPGGIEGMKYNMKHFMNATDKRYWNRDIDPHAIERMMFDPDERTIDRIISLMENRYNEIEEMEQRMLREHLEKLKKRQNELRAQAREKACEIDTPDSDSSDTSPATPVVQDNTNINEDSPVIEEVEE